MADPAYIVDGVLTDGEAWVPIATIDVTGTSTTTITFTSTDDGHVGDFSQYMDLFMVGYASGIYGFDTSLYLRYQLNNDTGSNYVYQDLDGDGSNATASTGSSNNFGWLPTSNATNVFAAYTGQFFDINSGKYKSVIAQTAMDGNGAGNRVRLLASTWKSQAPITEIDFYEPNGFAFVAGSKFSLFGILPRMVA